MSWRIILITKRAKLDFRLDHMVIRSDSITKIHLSEISTVIIESTEVSMTAALLSQLVKHKIKVVFCDEKRNPVSELIGYYGSHDTSLKVRQQIRWEADARRSVWTEIITEKIRKQKNLLARMGKHEAAELLESYILEIEFNDETNREGHAAKVYFNAMFGKEFSRTLDIPINAALNYGYSLILSAVNREIVKSGYITQIGLFHDNMFNPFNLGSDLMEPFRPLVDERVIEMSPEKFEHEEKISMIELLNEQVLIDGKQQFLNNAIGIYCRSIFEAINDRDVSLIRFYQCQNEL